MADKLPWFKLFADEWLRDMELRAVSDEARALWIDLLALMSQSTRRGFLAHRDGSPLLPDEIGRLTGRSAETVTRLLGELQHVHSQTSKGVIFSKSMAEEEQKRQASVKAGARGGNPLLLGGSKGTLNGGVKGEVNPPLFSLPLTSEPLKSDSSGKRLGGAGEGEGFAEFWASYPRKKAKEDAIRAWNKLAPNEALRATIMAALDRQMTWKQWREDDGKFVPHPVTWLNGRRWEDQEPELSTKRGQANEPSKRTKDHYRGPPPGKAAGGRDGKTEGARTEDPRSNGVQDPGAMG